MTDPSTQPGIRVTVRVELIDYDHARTLYEREADASRFQGNPRFWGQAAADKLSDLSGKVIGQIEAEHGTPPPDRSFPSAVR